MGDINISKQLGGGDDLLVGRGLVAQTRAGVPVNIRKLDLAVGVDSITELSTLIDPTKYPRAYHYTSAIEYTEYLYLAGNLDGVPALGGAGSWYPVVVTAENTPNTLDDPTTIKTRLDSLETTKADLDQLQYKNLTDVIPATGPHISYDQGDGLRRPIPLLTLGTQERDDLVLGNTEPKTYTNPTAPVTVLFETFTAAGSGFTYVANGIRLDDGSKEFELYAIFPTSVTARSGSANASYPLTVRYELYKNGSALASPIVIEETFTQDSSVVMKLDTPITEAQTGPVANGDIFTWRVWFSSRNNVGTDDSITVDTNALFSVLDITTSAGNLAISSQLSGSRRLSIDAAATQTFPSVTVTELGNIVEWSAGNVRANTPDVFFIPSLNAFILDRPGSSNWDIKLSIPVSKAGGGGSGTLIVSGVLEYSSDSTDGVDGTWAQSPQTVNSAPLTLSDGGEATAEYQREVRLEAGDLMYRLRLYAGDSSAGTIDSIVRTNTDAGTGFTMDTRPFIRIKETSRT